MQRLTRMICLLAMALAALPASAQIYKWVDENGVTNYSGDPPAAKAAATKSTAVADRISVYAPEPGVQRAIGANAANRERINSARIDTLERQLAAERQSSQHAAAADTGAAQAAYAQCLAERRIDCDNDGYTPYAYAPYGIVAVQPSPRPRPRHHHPAVTRPGASAGSIARPRAKADPSPTGPIR
jgi:hypothetical protein